MFVLKYFLIFILILFERSIGTELTTNDSTINLYEDDVQIDFSNEFELSDVIELNVGGELIVTTRNSLTIIPKSVLSILFNGRWEQKLSLDDNQNIFFDLNPILFRHLIDQLQIFDKEKFNEISFPSNPSLILPFKKMLRKLHLDHLLATEKNTLTLNIGGKIMTNQQTTFAQISNSTEIIHDEQSDVFIDHNPKLFRYLTRQLRQNLSTNKCFFKAPSIREKFTFEKLIKDLHLNQRSMISFPISKNTQWKQDGISVAGNNEQGNELNQLSAPFSVRVDNDDGSIYVADYSNHRIVQWKCSENSGEIAAGGNGQGNQTNQLNQPRDLFIDQFNDSLIICDYSNRRIVQWSRSKRIYQQTIISNIDCWAITLDNIGQIYISDWKLDAVKRYNRQLNQIVTVAGENTYGTYLNRLNYPNYLVVDDNYSIYISDWKNHRVVKWIRGATEGIIVAGGNGEGNRLDQLSHPQGIFVDHLRNIYIVDCRNHRIVRWSPQDKQGTLIIGDTIKGNQSHQLDHPIGIDFDQFNNIFITDHSNNRVQTFFIETK